MPNWVKVAEVGELGPNTAKRVLIGRHPIAVYFVKGEYLATDDTCSHEEASLAEGDIFGEFVECPRHGARFNIRSGKALSLPAVLPVKTYEVKVEDSEVQVNCEGLNV